MVVYFMKKKCEKYWPELGHPVVYGDITVTLSSEESWPDYTVRCLRCSKVRKPKFKLRITRTRAPVSVKKGYCHGTMHPHSCITRPLMVILFAAWHLYDSSLNLDRCQCAGKGLSSKWKKLVFYSDCYSIYMYINLNGSNIRDKTLSRTEYHITPQFKKLIIEGFSLLEKFLITYM